MVVHSQELWRNVVDYFMPKNIDPSTQRATYESVRNFLIQVQSSLMKFLPGILEKIPSFLTSTGLVLFFTIVGAIYLSYYFLTVKDFIPRFYPKKVRGIAISFLEDTYKNLERYVISVVVIALIVGVVVGIVVHSMGLKYSLLMGTWAAFTNLIPIVGVPLEFIPLFLLAVSTQDLVLVITLMIILVIVHASAFILFLVFMKGYNRINPVIIILMIVIAGQLWGLFGAIIAVPFAIVLKMTWMHFSLQCSKKKSSRAPFFPQRRRLILSYKTSAWEFLASQSRFSIVSDRHHRTRRTCISLKWLLCRQRESVPSRRMQKRA